LAFAHDSVEHVKNHEKYSIFKDYAEFIGIDKREHLVEWDPIVARVAKYNAEQAEKKAEEQKQREIETEEKRLEKEALEAEAKQRVYKDYFKMLNNKGLNQFVGQPKKLKDFKFKKIAHPIPQEA